MKKTTLLLLSLFSLLFIGSAARSQTHIFSGTVTTPDGLSPDVVTGASILVMPGNHTATTDSKGKFSMQIPAGTYEVTPSASGYTSYTMDLSLNSSKHVVFSLAPVSNLRSAQYSLGGRVVTTSGSNVNGIAGATVTIIPGNITAKTGSDGAFNFPNIAQGDYKVTASAPGFSSTMLDVTVDGSKQIVLNLPAGTSR